jgi:competence protein ComEC
VSAETPSGAHPSVRLFALAGALSVGVLLAEAIHPAPALAVPIGAGAGLGLVAGARSRRAAAVALAAGLALGFTLAGLRLASLDRSALAAGGRAHADALVEGRVLTDPEPVEGAVRLELGVERAEIDGRPVRLHEHVQLTVRPPRAFEQGDRLRADVRLGPLIGANADAQIRASAARLLHRGIAARAHAAAGSVERLGPARDPLSRVARAGRAAMSRAASRLPERERGLFLGVTIGDTTLLDPTLSEDFRATGLSHLTAVSGANLAMFLGAITVLLRLARIRRRTTVAVLTAALLAFMAITRFEPSVLRAGAMAAVGLTGVALGARREALTALGVACLGLLAWDPFLIHAIGFQLSALATVGILALAPRLAAAARGRKLAAAASVTLGAQLAVAPLIALQFHQVSLVALPANLMAAPAVAPATVLGFAAAAGGAIWAPLGAACSTLSRPALAWMSGVARNFARVPAAAVDTPGGAAGIAVLVLLCALPLVALRARRPTRGAPVLLAIALLAATTAWARALSPPPLAGLVVTALDVGQGDAWLVRAPGGATMLVDGGPDQRRIAAKLRSHGVRRIDLLVMTHPHADHVDGLAAVVGHIAIGRAIESGLQDTRPALRTFREGLAAAGVPRDVVRRGGGYRLGEAVVDVLGPAALLQGTNSDLNNNSVVLRIRYGSTCLLMSGEVQEEGQQALLEHPEDLRCPVMTVPHHGSRHMLPAYFGATGARVAMISVGAHNDFGHPSGETLAVLHQLGIRVLRTDLEGDVSAGISSSGVVEVRTERPEPAAA